MKNNKYIKLFSIVILTIAMTIINKNCCNAAVLLKDSGAGILEVVNKGDESDSKYAFSIESNDSTYLEFWGDTGKSYIDSENAVIIPTSHSKSDNIGCYIYNCGKYNGKNVNLKCTFYWKDVTDGNGQKIHPIIRLILARDRKAIDFCFGTIGYGVKYEILDEDMNPITVNLSASINDIDCNQYFGAKKDSTHINKIQCLNNSTVYYKEDSDYYWFYGDSADYDRTLECSARIEYNNVNTFDIWYGCEGDKYSFPGVVDFGYVVSDNDLENRLDRALLGLQNDDLSMIDCGGGFFNGAAFGPYNVSKPIKYVLDKSGNKVNSNSIEKNDVYTYSINEFVPQENSAYYYDSFSITDTIPDNLTYIEAKVYNTVNSEVTDKFNITVSENQVTATLKDPKDSSFYGQNYELKIKVKMNLDVINNSNSGNGWNYDESNHTYSITNISNANITRNSTTKSELSNEVTTKYKRKDSKIIVKYIDKYTNNEIIASENISGYDGKEYIVNKKDISGYTFDGENQSVSGTMTENDITITFYYIKQSNVVTKYVDENTGAEIPGVDSITTTYKEKDPYTTEKKTIDGYTYTRDTANTSGTVGRTNIEVVYYYKKNSGLTIKYLDKYKTDLEVADSKSITGLEGDNYTTTKKDVSGYVYDSVVGNANGRLQATATTVTYYYIKQSNVVTKYIDENTGTEIPGVDSITTTYKEKDSYTTEKKTIDGYTYTRDTVNTSGTVGRDNINVVYYYKKNSGVTVKYLDKYATDIEVADAESITGLEGDNYNTTKKDVSGYVYDSVVGNANGRLQAAATTVTYYYIKQSNVVTKYVDENTGAEIPGVGSVTTTYKEKDPYTTEKKTIDGYTYTRDTANTSGTVGRDNINVVYYYKKNSGVTVKYLDKYQTDLEVADSDNINGLEGAEYTTTKKDVPGYVYDSVVGDVSGNIGSTATTVTYYYIKQSNVVTKYIDENTGAEISGVDSITTTYKEKDSYSTEKKTIDGYTYTRDTANTSGTVGRTNIEVKYYYKKNSGVTVKYLDKYQTDLEVAGAESITGLEGDSYNTTRKDVSGYVYDSVDGTVSGNIGAAPITVTYYYIKESNVVTKYIDENTGAEISGVDSVTTTYKEKDPYSTEKKTIDGYTYTRDSANTSGTVGRTNIDVVYYYKKNSGVTVRYLDKYQTDLEVADAENITGLEGAEYTATKKDISGYVYDSVDGAVNGNIGPAPTTVTYYYIKQSNIVTKYIDENTGAEIPGVDSNTTTYKEKDPYTTEKKEITGYTYTRDTANTSGTVGRNPIEVIYYYKKNSGLTVKYIDKYQTDLEVADSENITGLEGDSYNTNQKDVAGYVYDSVVGESSGNIGATATTITYYYIKQSDVVTKYIDENTGAEIPGVDSITTTYKEKDPYTTEKKTIDGYTYTRDTANTNGTVGRNNIEVIYYYKKNSGLTIRYIDKYATDLEVADSVSITGLEGAEYTTTPIDVSGYVYDSVVGETSGNLGPVPTTVTYYYIKQSNVVAKYIDENTGAEIPGVDSITTTYKEKDPYATEKKTIDRYTYTRDTENTSGTIGRENIDVIYYYKKNSRVTVKYIDKYQTDLEVADSESITGLEGDDYSTVQKDVSGYAYDSVDEDVSGKLQAAVTTVTYKYVKESNVTTKYIDELTGEEIHDEKVVTYKQNDVYSTSAEEIDGYTLVITPDNKNGIVQRENITVTYEYRKISQGVEIQYIDQANGNKIASSIIKNGVEGTEYTSEAKVIPGYELVRTPDNANGVMAVEKTIVTYEYRLKAYVTVNYEDEITKTPLKTPISKKYLEGEEYSSTQESFDGYTFSRVEGTPNGTMGRTNIVITYYYKRNVNVIVKYVDMLDGDREIVGAKTIDGVEGQAYTTEPLEIPGYEYIRSTGKTSGNMTVEPITVVYKYKKLATLTTTHIDIDSGEEIHDPVVTTYKEGDMYEALPQNIAGYVKVEEPTEKTGVMGRENITRTYKYKKVSGGLVVKYVDVKTNDVLDESVYSGTVGDTIDLETKSFMYYLLYSKPESDTVTLTNEEQEVIYYYIRTIKMDVIGVEEKTGKELFRTKIEGQEGDPYNEEEKKDLEGYELVEMPANAKGFFNRNDTEIIFVYRKIEQKVGTSVVAKYIDRDTEKELDTATITGYVGDTYRTERKEFAGYELVKIEGDEYGNMEEEQKVVKYIYTRKSGKVIVNYEDEEGNVLDSEELTGKVGEDYEVKVKEFDGYEVVEIPDNAKGEYTEDTIEVIIKLQKIHVAPAEDGIIIVKFIDSEGNTLREEVVQKGDVGENFYFEAPQIDGYRIVINSNIKAEFKNEEQVFDVIYEKISVEEPKEEKDVETGDINVLVLTVIFGISIIGIKKKFSIK